MGRKASPTLVRERARNAALGPHRLHEALTTIRLKPLLDKGLPGA